MFLVYVQIIWLISSPTIALNQGNKISGKIAIFTFSHIMYLSET
jgi:hypothetical protein